MLEKGAFLLSTCRGHCTGMTNPGGDGAASKVLLALGLGAVFIFLFPALTLIECARIARVTGFRRHFVRVRCVLD